jgi:hypothetical protein
MKNCKNFFYFHGDFFYLVLLISSESQEPFLPPADEESYTEHEIDVPMHEIPKNER